MAARPSPDGFHGSYSCGAPGKLLGRRKKMGACSHIVLRLTQFGYQRCAEGDDEMFSFARCAWKGHVFVDSRSQPGMQTCVRCRARRPFEGSTTARATEAGPPAE
jgi:hypothetical protein